VGTIANAEGLATLQSSQVWAFKAALGHLAVGRRLHVQQNPVRPSSPTGALWCQPTTVTWTFTYRIHKFTLSS
jgi:hypothetical protein